MVKIRDFKCTYQNHVGICPEATRGLDLKFPEAYLHAETMAQLAVHIRQTEHAGFCELPFCHTVEAEAMGGMINLGDGRTGPRAKEYICTDPAKLLELPAIDYSSGRIAEVLKACRILKEQGEIVVFMISGPFTILNVLIDPRYVFKGMRKKPEIMKQVFDKIREELLRFTARIVDAGADIISYADSSGSLNIIGPDHMKWITEYFTWPYLKEAAELTGQRTQIALCPKTSFALTGLGLAEWKKVPVEGKVSYVEACLQAGNKGVFTGQMCLKNTGYMADGKIHILVNAADGKNSGKN